jgi:hypothetical protein
VIVQGEAAGVVALEVVAASSVTWEAEVVALSTAACDLSCTAL